MHRVPDQVDYSKKWFVMAAVASGTFLATIDGSIVNIALPTLSEALHAEFSMVEWVVLIYLLTVTLLMLGVGRLADMIGKKPIYATGFVIFTLGSMLCGISSTIYMLIGFRVLQAIGASMMMALGMAIITESFPPSQRGMALGVGGLMVSLGVIAGPTIGGIILEATTWHWLFFVNVPIGVIGIFMVLRFVPSLKPKGGERYDFLGNALLLIGLVSLLLALTFGQKIGFNQPLILGLVLLGLIFLFVFAWVENRVQHPLMDLSLFRQGLFSINLITGFITFVPGSGITLLMPFYLQNVLGYSPRTIGLMMAVVPITVGIVGPISGYLSDRIGSRLLTVAGLAVLSLGYWGLTSLNETTSTISYLLHFLPIGVGIGLFQSPNNSAIMGAAPKERLGVASGLLAITRTMGQTTGVATVAAMWSAMVSLHAGSLITETTSAPIPLQVAGLHDTILLMVGLLVVAFALSAWALIVDLRTRRAAKG